MRLSTTDRKKFRVRKKLKKVVRNDFGKDPIIGRDLIKIKI